MCLVLVSFHQSAQYPVVIASNRDEFLERPTRAAHFWDDQKDLVAGRDLKEGGTWLAATRKGRFAALSNYRDPTRSLKDKRSRGLIIPDCLTSLLPTETQLVRLLLDADHYNDFNLILGSPKELYYYSNFNRSVLSLAPGAYGVSNHHLDSPWPKLKEARYRFEKIVAQSGKDWPRQDWVEQVFSVMRDTQQAKDEQLPSTGVSLEWERRLSSIFIEGKEYGTRTTTVMFLTKDGKAMVEERTYDGNPNVFSKARFDFELE